MARRCDSNTAQYERNRSFGHLVHALGRAAGGAKLPSAGLCLNASKAVASLAESGKDTLAVEPRESGGSKQCDFTSRIDHHGRFDVEAHSDHGDLGVFRSTRAPRLRRSAITSVRCRGSESSVDDFRSWRGVVLGRAASCCDLLRLSPTPGDSSEDDDIILLYIYLYIIS
ncbi:hypothetical protein EVAR_47604_1 [Eumeta japonica]|uniref:Uncharacterized protein n=1 Tax=Eumeta variegata TaxID=151549 RepID=A0A4C1WRL7_EUMVA|nr:hypothetical protein EVAR_47604_1 [Eumeta japonica]